MTRPVRLPPAEKAGEVPDFTEMSELDVLLWSRSAMLTMMTSIKAAAQAGDVYPQLARELAALSGKINQTSAEIRQQKKAAKEAAKKLTPEKKLRACVQLARQLPKRLQREAAAQIGKLAAEGGMKL